MEQLQHQRVVPTQVNKSPQNNHPRVPAFDQWCQATAWHGISDCRKSESVCLKSIWIIAIISCAIISVSQCTSLILDFAWNERWVTSVTFGSSPDGGLDWPDITICNLNTIFQSQLAMYNFTDPYHVAHMFRQEADSLRFFDQYQADKPSFKNDEDVKKKLKVLNERMAFFTANRSLSEIINTITLACNKTAIHCGFTDTFDLRNKVNSCCDQSTARLHCFSVSSSNAFGKNYKGLGRDSVYLLLNPRTTDYHTSLTKYELPSEGLRVQLFYGNPDLAAQSDLLLAPGTHTVVSLIKQTHRTVVRRFRVLDFYEITMPCSSKGNYTYYNYTSYSNKLCITDCTTRSLMQMCNCTLVTAYSIPIKGLKECMGEKVVACSNLMMTIFSKMQAGHDDPEIVELKDCMNKCDEECEFDNVDVKISTSVFPAQAKLKAFTTYLNRAFADTGTQFSEEETKQLIFFEMVYGLNQVRIIEKVTRTTTAELISNIGGAMGVWTGLSILSIYQGCIYLVKGLCRLK